MNTKAMNKTDINPTSDEYRASNISLSDSESKAFNRSICTSCSPDIYIKNLEISDIKLLEQIARAEAANFSHPLSELSLTHMLDSKAYGIAALLNTGGKVLSYTVYSVSLDEVQILSVCSPVKGQGYAYRMLNALIPQLKTAGIRKICLEVRISNIAARALYEKLGFITDGYRKNLYDNPTEDGCIMHI